MPKIYSLEQFMHEQEFFLKEARNNKIFVYPTDTIYGIGAIATPENKQRINHIKQSPSDKLLSVIAPDISWIQKNYPIPEAEKVLSKENIYQYIDSHDGVTFIFDPLFRGGVRLIKHDFQNFVEALGESFITTSVNPSGQKNCSKIVDIHPKILAQVDYLIDGGSLDGKASVLINLLSGELQWR